MQQLAHALAPEPAEPAPAPTTFRLECNGRMGELARIALVNGLLTILTLGVYRFWAKTRVRRYLWSRTSLLGDAFEYTGTGGELFRGFLIVAACVLAPLFAYQMAVELLVDAERWGLRLALLAPWYAVILFLIGIGTHRARRYRFSRTVWRGVRAAQQGSALRYGALYLGCMLLTIATLGWAHPWGKTRLTRALTDDAWFGDRRFVFHGGAGPLYGVFAINWLGFVVGATLVLGGVALAAAEGLLESSDFAGLAIVAAIFLLLIGFSLVFAWYAAREAAYLTGCTRYEGLRLRYEVTAGALLWLTVGNLLLFVATLGMGGALVELRTLRFVCARLSFTGPLDAAAIAQSRAPEPRRGEGLAAAFDVGAM